MYDNSVGISAPPAGRAPNGKPRAVPRSHGFQERLQSDLLIQGTPTGMTSSGRRRRWAATHSASPTAKIATATTTMSIPSASNALPKVSRGWPVWVPIRPIARPRNRAMKPRSRDRPSTAVTASSAKSIRAKYEGAPSSTTSSATGGARKTSRAVPIDPATNDPIAAVASAWAARPVLAILLPSRAVITEEDSPGVFSRIEVVDPPYIPP
jgi:hypothetical protein